MKSALEVLRRLEELYPSDKPAEHILYAAKSGLVIRMPLDGLLHCLALDDDDLTQGLEEIVRRVSIEISRYRDRPAPAFLPPQAPAKPR